MHLGFSSMNTADDPEPALLARTLEEAGFAHPGGTHHAISAGRRPARAL
jgi:hypothetical protein